MGWSWVDSLRARLDGAAAPVTFFFRDDDAGWRDDRLFALLDRFSGRGLPLDVAVIPSALRAPLARELRARHAAAPDRLGLHQHGFAHLNHEPDGRKQEFGPSRSASEQRHDIAAGRRELERALGPICAPIFTPPWNRCTSVTGEVLVELGFRVLSRESRTVPLDVPGLLELPVHVDWFAKRKGVRLSREAVGDQLGEAVASGEPVGLMLHHADMGPADMEAADELLDLLSGHPNCRFTSMLSLAEERRPTVMPGACADWEVQP